MVAGQGVPDNCSSNIGTCGEVRRSEQGMSSPLPVVAVVIPAYCAAAHIEQVLAGIPHFVSHVVVVDDYSKDQTATLVSAWHDRRVHLVKHKENQGVGGAVLSGYDKAIELGAEIIVKMDSDNQMDPAFLLPLIAPLASGEADYTKGNRFFHARALRSMSVVRRVGNAGLSFLTKLASGYWNVFDPANGYTAIHASLVPLLDRKAIDRRFFFETSMLLELGLLRAVVRDICMPARYGDEGSFLSERRALMEFPPRLLRGFARRVILQHFVRDFSVLSLLLVIGLLLAAFGLAFGAYHWHASATTGARASTGTVMLAILPIILGVQFLLEALVADIQNVPVHPLQVELQWASRVQREFERYQAESLFGGNERQA